VNNIFAKQYRYRRHGIKCCRTCIRHWINPILNTIQCSGSFTRDGMPTRVDFNGICKMYCPEKQEAGRGTNSLQG
jgi:hypothetical protein